MSGNREASEVLRTGWDVVLGLPSGLGSLMVSASYCSQAKGIGFTLKAKILVNSLTNLDTKLAGIKSTCKLIISFYQSIAQSSDLIVSVYLN